MLIPMEECIKINLQLGNAPITGVLHIGASIGQEIQSYTNCGIKQVCWIEANKSLFKNLYDNTCKFPVKQQYISECLSDADGEKITFNITNNNGESSSILPLGTHKQHHPQVHVVETRELITKRFDTLYKENMALIPLESYSMLNLDIQGAELKALKGFGNLLAKYPISLIYSEINIEHLYENCCLVEELDEYLEQFGFKRVITKLTEFGWGDSIFARKI